MDSTLVQALHMEQCIVVPLGVINARAHFLPNCPTYRYKFRRKCVEFLQQGKTVLQLHLMLYHGHVATIACMAGHHKLMLCAQGPRIWHVHQLRVGSRTRRTGLCHGGGQRGIVDPPRPPRKRPG